MKPILLALILTFLSSIAHAQALPKPAEPSPTLPNSANQERYTYIDRPYKPANSETYTTKKVPLDKSKMGKWFKKLSKPDMISIGILALGEAVDYVLDPANNTAQFTNLQCRTIGYGNFTANSFNDFVSKMKEVEHRYFFGPSGKFTLENTEIYRTNQDGYKMRVGVCTKPQEKTQIPLDELADKIIDAAKKGNPDAKKWVQDWADDEVHTNPNAYPEHQPSPQPNPKDEPQAEPRPKPSPDTNPNAQPQPNPSETIKPCEKGYYRTAHGFCVPDLAYNPNKDTNPKDNPKPNPRPDDELNPSPNTRPDKEQKPFELPAFCDWAGVVCDFIGWVKEPPPEPEAPQDVPKAGLGDISDLQSVDRFKQRINFDGQCPTGTLSFEVKAVAYSYQIPYHHFCQLLEQLRPWLLAFTYLSTAFFVVRSL